MPFDTAQTAGMKWVYLALVCKQHKLLDFKHYTCFWHSTYFQAVEFKQIKVCIYYSFEVYQVQKQFCFGMNESTVLFTAGCATNCPSGIINIIKVKSQNQI